MKQITIIGNLGSNAVVRTTADGRQLMSFSVAVSRRDQPATWFNCVGNLRENLLQHLIKGQCVCVTGDLAARVYQNAPDLSVSIDRVELCGAKPDAQTAPAESAQQAQADQDADPFA